MRGLSHAAAIPQHFRNPYVPFILLGLALIGAFIYGLVRLYQKVASTFGMLAGTAAVLAVLAVLAALGMAWLRRYRAIHGRRVNGKRVVAISGDWGSLRLDAEHKNGVLEIGGQREVLIFADIAEARPQARQGRWHVVLTLRHHKQPEWVIPMPDRDTASRWEKIFRLAAAQKL